MEQAIFVVEGDVDLRRALGEVFEDEGWCPVLFASPEEALGALGRAEPWFLVTDLRFMGMSGDEMLLTLARESRWSRLSLAVFTAWMDIAVAQRLDVPIVMKPHFAVLLDLIRSAATTRQADGSVSPAVAAAHVACTARFGPRRAPRGIAARDVKCIETAHGPIA